MIKSIGFIGGGNMSRAILTSLSQKKDAYKLYVCDRNEEKRAFFQEELKISAAQNYQDFIAALDIIVLAIKPQGFPELLTELAPLIQPHQLIISIAAGVSVEAILRGIRQQHHPVIRVMPNTPATIGLGASAIYANPDTSPENREIADSIFKGCGITAWLESEEQISAAVAVSGSSPAYIFYLMEIMAKVGESMGLDAQNSLALTTQAVLGAAKYSALSTLSLESLKKNVMSPKGTTECAIMSLESNHIDRIIAEAMQAAFDRDQALSKIISDKIVR